MPVFLFSPFSTKQTAVMYSCTAMHTRTTTKAAAKLYLYGYPWYFDLKTESSQLKNNTTKPIPAIHMTARDAE